MAPGSTVIQSSIRALRDSSRLKLSCPYLGSPSPVALEFSESLRGVSRPELVQIWGGLLDKLHFGSCHYLVSLMGSSDLTGKGEEVNAWSFSH